MRIPLRRDLRDNREDMFRPIVQRGREEGEGDEGRWKRGKERVKVEEGRGRKEGVG